MNASKKEKAKAKTRIIEMTNLQKFVWEKLNEIQDMDEDSEYRMGYCTCMYELSSFMQKEIEKELGINPDELSNN